MLRTFSLLSLILLGLACGAPNFVIILTDDQDLLLRGLTPMKETLKLIANNGATFTNAYVNTPICCPSRSTILTGKYLHNTEVYNNSISGGCSSINWQINHEPHSLAAELHDNNYVTFYAGKYLNQYGNDKVGGTSHVPKGYDWWTGLKGNSKYYNYTLSVNGTAKHFTNSYLTDVLNDYASAFLNQKAVLERPFLMIIAPPAAHAPFTPAERHKSRFRGLKAPRDEAFNRTSLDKHWLVSSSPNRLPRDVLTLDEIYKRRFQTLLAVDEMAANLVRKLREIKRLADTYVIFTSDNGFHIGQYAMPWDKRLPYETDIKVPFLIRGPGIGRKSLIDYPVSSVDLMPTILDLAAIRVPDYVDGVSFEEALVLGEKRAVHKTILIEYRGEGDARTVSDKCPQWHDTNVAECDLENWCKCQDSKNNTYNCLRHFIANEINFKYCEFEDDNGFVEMYDLNTDPHELINLRQNFNLNDAQKYKKLVEILTKCGGSNCTVTL